MQEKILNLERAYSINYTKDGERGSSRNRITTLGREPRVIINVLPFSARKGESSARVEKEKQGIRGVNVFTRDEGKHRFPRQNRRKWLR